MSEEDSEMRATEARERADILLKESSMTLILDGFTSDIETPWCRVHFLTFECPRCHHLHSIDLRLIDLLEITSQEKWTMKGIIQNSCGRFDVDIKGTILITPKKINCKKEMNKGDIIS
jgi:hypothetical protein